MYQSDIVGGEQGMQSENKHGTQPLEMEPAKLQDMEETWIKNNTSRIGSGGGSACAYMTGKGERMVGEMLGERRQSFNWALRRGRDAIEQGAI